MKGTDIELGIQCKEPFGWQSPLDILFFLLHMSHALCILRFLRPCVERLSPSLQSSSLDDIKRWIWTFPAEVSTFPYYNYIGGRRTGGIYASETYIPHELPIQFNIFMKILTANCRKNAFLDPFGHRISVDNLRCGVTLMSPVPR